jgi:hypothetical protein
MESLFMKKFFLFAGSLIFLFLLTFVFVQFKENPSGNDEKWKLESIQEVELMSVKEQGTTFSEAYKVLLRKKLRFESVPLTAYFTFSSEDVNELEKIVLRINYKNIHIEEEINALDISPENSISFIRTHFFYDLSRLKETVSEDELLEFINVFPSDPKIAYSIRPVYETEKNAGWVDLRSVSR